MRPLIPITFMFLVSFVSCGKNQSIVKEISVGTERTDESFLVDLTTTLQLRGLSFAGITLPIRSQDKTLGKLSLSPRWDGHTEVQIQVDAAKVHQQILKMATLPDGQSIPIRGLPFIYEIPIQGHKAKVYVGIDSKQFILGFAVDVSQFATVSRSLRGINILPRFSIQGVEGVAGFYSGQKGGILFLADLQGQGFQTDTFQTKDLRALGQAHKQLIQKRLTTITVDKR